MLFVLLWIATIKGEQMAINIKEILEVSAVKTAKALASKEAKKTNQNEDFVRNLLTRQISAGLKATEHFAERFIQRFTANESESLSSAISRAIRKTQPQENGCNHKTVSQKIIDEPTGIVTILERQGRFGAVLVTTYKLGCENLLSDSELRDLKLRGLL